VANADIQAGIASTQSIALAVRVALVGLARIRVDVDARCVVVLVGVLTTQLRVTSVPGAFVGIVTIEGCPGASSFRVAGVGFGARIQVVALTAECGGRVVNAVPRFGIAAIRGARAFIRTVNVLCFANTGCAHTVQFAEIAGIAKSTLQEVGVVCAFPGQSVTGVDRAGVGVVAVECLAREAGSIRTRSGAGAKVAIVALTLIID